MIGFRIISLTTVVALSAHAQNNAWEGNVLGGNSAGYVWKDGAYDTTNSKFEEPSSWFPQLVDCEVDPLTRRCSGVNRLRSRNLQAGDAYIEVIFDASFALSDDVRLIFQTAADVWNNAIAANGLRPFGVTFTQNGQNIANDLEDVDLVQLCGNFGITDVSEPSKVFMLASVAPIDGAGGTLAQAAPCVQLDDAASNTQTYVGFMQFDEVDFANQIANNQRGLQDTVIHEMGHILGIGSSWQRLGLVGAANTATPGYVGVNGNLGFELLGVGGNAARVEDEGGSGTALVHWDENTFQNELMTGFINKSLLDLGLTINECAAQDFGTFTFDAAACVNFVNPNSEFDPDNGGAGIAAISDNLAIILLVILGGVLAISGVVFVVKRRRNSENLASFVNKSDVPRVVSDVRRDYVNKSKIIRGSSGRQTNLNLQSFESRGTQRASNRSSYYNEIKSMNPKHATASVVSGVRA